MPSEPLTVALYVLPDSLLPAAEIVSVTLSPICKKDVPFEPGSSTLAPTMTTSLPGFAGMVPCWATNTLL